MKDKKSINEKKFTSWEDLSDGGRRYWLDIIGKNGWKARYIKEVNPDEEAMKFYQEIYNEKEELIEIHEKFPEDKGHVSIKGR
jgi:hypothetical protein